MRENFGQPDKNTADAQFLLYSTPLPNAHPLDTIVLALYLVAAVSCMFSSAMWHVLSGCASKKWFEWGACVDCTYQSLSSNIQA